MTLYWLFYRADFVLTVCSQRVYLLQLLRSQSLQIQQLRMVFVAAILSRITYALPAWGGQLTRQLQKRFDAFLKRARTFGFVMKIIPQPN